jgi:hypothetical protein
MGITYYTPAILKIPLDLITLDNKISALHPSVKNLTFGILAHYRKSKGSIFFREYHPTDFID